MSFDPTVISQILKLEKEDIIFQSNSFLNNLRITYKYGLVKIEEYHYGNRSVLKFHVSKLNQIHSFSRVYHLGMIITSIFLGILSTILLIKKWSSNEWTFFLALIPLTIIALGYVYYFVIGIKVGEVVLEFDGSKKYLYMTKENYLELKEKIDSYVQR